MYSCVLGKAFDTLIQILYMYIKYDILLSCGVDDLVPTGEEPADVEDGEGNSSTPNFVRATSLKCNWLQAAFGSNLNW